ncbi:hypothetical protein NDU88_002452 [Pleurodeles waltl]|uniref:Uncharacterized protein n=1 Tax=Pleurodeles waltl TaxID=8319 RepID=A0AAV7PE25_PLEWA|nr:hypothetical protein NDU88_002452 [Pleurodeles waltl]
MQQDKAALTGCAPIALSVDREHPSSRDTNQAPLRSCQKITESGEAPLVGPSHSRFLIDVRPPECLKGSRRLESAVQEPHLPLPGE